MYIIIFLTFASVLILEGTRGRLKLLLDYKSNRPYRLLFVYLQPDGLDFYTRRNALRDKIISMKIKAISIKVEYFSDSEKTKPTKVAPYIRTRNGKREYVKGYIRKK